MRAIGLALTVVLLAACPKAGFVAAGPPKRPEPKAKADAAPKVIDCAPMEPSQGGAAVAYKDRMPELGQKRAEEGKNVLIDAGKDKYPPPQRNALYVQAVTLLIEALSADPYNVVATYNLAAAYAHIGRKNCALNLLARLAEMAAFPSARDDVSEMADYLLGRGKRKGKADPDFDSLRDDPRFNTIIKAF
jgi:hypothetical protein